MRQKVKTKLGKGKKVPSNATDTSFKARCTYYVNIETGEIYSEEL